MNRLFPMMQALIVLAVSVLPGSITLAQSPAPPSSALQRTQPLEPAAAVQSFVVKDGFSLQLVAAEPLVTDPVAGAFDEDGRLYVVEMNDYPYTDKSTDKPNVERTMDLPIGKVRRLEDANDDGVFDQSTIFARDLSWPTGIAVWRGGVFVTATPDVWYLKDGDGDGVAEIREKVFTGFRKLNVQAVVNNLIWGLDHRIYGAGGTNGGKVSSAAASFEPVTFVRNDFRFSPEERKLELQSGGARFGNTFDDWGHRFICNIRNPMQHVVLPWKSLNRNPSFAAGSPLHDVAAAGDQIRVYRASPPEPWRVVNAARLTSQGDPRMPRSEKNAAGFLTSSSGVTVYRGDAYPAEFRQQMFLAEVAGNLIHRQQMQSTGVTFTSTRIDDESEFAASTDNWFRPVNFLHAPDGTLHVLDMYRETIEHPWSMPDDLKGMLDLENGRDRGRIYRLTPTAFRRRATPKLSQFDSAELVTLLSHPNAWHRETAHRLLFERQDLSVVPALKEQLRTAPAAIGRLHAMWTLDGLKQLQSADIAIGFADAHAEVRRSAVFLAELHCLSDLNQTLLQGIRGRADDSSPGVRMQVALTLGEFADTENGEVLRQMARRDAADSWIVTAVLTARMDVASGMLAELCQDETFLEQPEHLPLLKQLALIAGSRKASDEVRDLGSVIAGVSEPLRRSGQMRELILALDDGLRRRSLRLAKVWHGTPAEVVLADLVNHARTQVADSALPVEKRLTAMKDLMLAEPATLPDLTLPLLSASQPAEIQIAAVRALLTVTEETVSRGLMEAYPHVTPAVQYEIVEAMANHPSRIPLLMDAITNGQISAGQITPIRRTLLLNHADAVIQGRAKKLLASDRETSRSDVLQQHSEVLKLAADVVRGRAVFLRECSVCHKVGEVGHDVGPSLITVRHRSPAELLTQILDPNREVGPAFMQYAVAQHDGQVLAGMIAEESAAAVTLRKAENRTDVVLRENIAEMRNTGLSLMPEGLEKKLTPQEMADVIEYVRNH
jgi:putative membrane-bound dehydrogenase-like protein